MKFRPMARYWMPGSFFAEDAVRELSDRSVDAAVTMAPDGAFAFQLYDSPICDFEFPADLFRIAPIPQNESAKHYLGGHVFDCDELRELGASEGDPRKYNTLISNITKWTPSGSVEGKAIRCRTGNWEPFEDDDVLVETDATAAR